MPVVALDRETILQAATEVFRCRGYRGASMRAIARQAGVSVGYLYKLFASKEDIYREVIKEVAEEARKRLQLLLSQDNAGKEAKLTALVRFLFWGAEEYGSLWWELGEEGGLLLSPEAREEIQQQFRCFLEEIFVSRWLKLPLERILFSLARSVWHLLPGERGRKEEFLLELLQGGIGREEKWDSFLMPSRK